MSSEQSNPSGWHERPVQILSRVSADDRGWSGLSATVFELTGGSIQPMLLDRHNVNVLVGPPLQTTIACDELAENRFQVPGSFDVLPAHSSVSWVDGGASIYLSVGLECALVQRCAFDMGINPDRVSLSPRLTCRDPRIEHVLWALKAEVEADDPYGRLYADSLGVALASQLIRRWSDKTPRPASRGLTPRTLKRVLAYISDRLADDISLADIAAAAALSPSHFAVLFKRSVGVSVHRYVLRRRVRLAIWLLSHTSMPIGEIAIQAGFSNASHMSSVLQRFLGMAPGALRASTSPL
ncbi:MAG: AraC family transcriptional regulator [Candidatus Cybelea sp.]